MTPELYNRIHNEVKDVLGREPSQNEVINSQSDHLIIYRVEKRMSDEKEYNMQQDIDYLTNKVNTLSKLMAKVDKNINI